MSFQDGKQESILLFFPTKNASQRCPEGARERDDRNVIRVRWGKILMPDLRCVRMPFERQVI